jgi:hypothetical protein
MFIKEVLEFKYVNKNRKIDNIKKAKNFEQLCNRQKEKFDDIVNKIQRQGEAFIESARNSKRLSNRNHSTERSESNLNINALHGQLDQMFKCGEEYLESSIEERQRQIHLITK